MSAANDVFPRLGPATEALIAAAFAERALITAGTMQDIIGVDDKTFGALVSGGAIDATKISPTTKRYTEAALRRYLAGLTELTPCPSTSRKTAATSTTTSSYAGSGFMDRPGRLRVVRQRP